MSHTPQPGSPSGSALCQSGCGPEGSTVPSVERVNVRLQAEQPVVPVPVYQEVYRRDKYIEVPHVEIKDTVVPRVYNQSAVHEVPKMDIALQEAEIPLSVEKRIERDVEVPVLVGYAPQFVPKWDVREVPRPIPKYEGEQEVIEVEVPQIEYKDRYVEKEVIVDVKEKIIPKVTEVVKEVEVMQYEWKEKYQDVPVYKYVPKFDVELDCPPPIIVPYPETRYVKDPPQTATPYCPASPCCGQQSAYTIRSTGEKIYLPSADTPVPPMVTTGSMHSMVPGVQMQSEDLPYSARSISSMQDYVVRGDLVGDAPGSRPQVPGIQLAPGPVFPMPTPQVEMQTTQSGSATARSGEGNGAELKMKKDQKKGLWNWLFGKKEEETEDHEKQFKGVPQTSTIPDFTAHFQNQQYAQQAMGGGAGPQTPTARSDRDFRPEDAASELEPTVTYKGAVSKPAEFGGELNPISFKLHAIEVHQFIPLPNVKVPEFVKALPDGLMTTDVSGIDKFFGPVPTGWADPDVTGIPAPMMSDILAGNIQATTTSPLINQLSQQFARQDSSTTAMQNRPQSFGPGQMVSGEGLVR